MIEYLACGIAIGLIPSVLLGLVCAWDVRLRRELEADYEELKGHGRQLCSEAEFSRHEVLRLKDELETWRADSAAMAERADRNWAMVCDARATIRKMVELASEDSREK